ncbi:MAG: class I SAM-dependent methyltransferase [Nocardioides sp.]
MNDPTPTHFSDPTTVEARRTSFGAGAATYDAVRPSWPTETVDWLLGNPDGALRVLDLGAGTGLGTRTVAAFGHDVVAVDPSAEMLAALEAADLAPDVRARIETRVSPAESLEDPAGSVDAVIAFQAWHWFDAAQVARECARVLRRGGWLGLAWHSWSDQIDWLRELGQLVGTPEMVWDPDRARRAAELDGFAPAENAQFFTEQVLTVEGTVRLASSWSPVAVREDREAVLDEVRVLAARSADAGGRLVFPYVSDCYRYRRQA